MKTFIGIISYNYGGFRKVMKLEIDSVNMETARMELINLVERMASPSILEIEDDEIKEIVEIDVLQVKYVSNSSIKC